MFDFDSIQLPKRVFNDTDDKGEVSFECRIDKSIEINFKNEYGNKVTPPIYLDGHILPELAKFLSEVYLDNADKK